MICVTKNDVGEDTRLDASALFSHHCATEFAPCEAVILF